MNGKPTGKSTRRKKPLPAGLTKEEEKVLKKVTRRAYRLDNCFSFCGIRVGWSSIIGIIPVAGDIFDVLMSLMLLSLCTKVVIPASLKSRMMMNIMLDFFIGLVPLVGDLGDSLFRANTKNAALLHEHLKARGQARINGGEKTTGKGQGFSRLQSPVHEQPRRQEQMELTQSPVHTPTHTNLRKEAGPDQPSRLVTADDIASPDRARLQKEKGSGGGWLSSLTGSRSRPERDLENGDAPAQHTRRG